MTETFIEDNSTIRRPMFIETEVRTDTITRRRVASTTANRSVHDILENTKSPTDGLPKTTYTYAHSISYMPVTQNGTYEVPVMARRDLHATDSRNSTTIISSPSRFVTNVRSSLANKYSEIRDRFTPHRNPLQSPSVGTTTDSYRPRTPVHSTPRPTSTSTSTSTKKVVQHENFLKKIFRFLPWWFWLPLLLLFLLYVFPQSICKPFEHYPESKIYQQCRLFEEYTKNVTTNCSNRIRDDFSQSFRYVTKFREYLADKYDDFRQVVKRWFGGVKQPVGEALDTAKEYCDAGLNKVNQLIEEVKKEREKFLGPKSALKPEQESQLQQLIQHIIDEYAADETGQADYALEANGAKVVGTRCTEYTDEPRQNVVKFLGIPIVHMSKQPDIMLKAGRLPGQCFPFKGDQGSVIIKLAVPVKPTEFVLEHLSKSISIVGHISSAPKNFTVTALKDKNDQEGRVLGRYFYDAENGPSLQRFAPQLPNVPLVEFIEVRVTSNWGNPTYTCLYRFRVHGDLKTVQPPAA